MSRNSEFTLAISVIVAIFLIVQLGALALIEPFKAAGLQAVENPQNPTNSILYIGAVLVMTGIMLLAFRYEIQAAIRAMIVVAGVYIAWLVFSEVFPPVVTLPVADGLHGVASIGALLLGIALYAYPEWYVIDVTGAIMGAGAAGLFGITFGILPALILLSVLAVYDAVSVYGTEHMLTLASGIMELKVPVVLVAPLTISYSFLEDPESVDDKTSEAEDTPEASDDEEDDSVSLEDRDAIFIGLGDAIIPSVLVASAGFFADPSIPTIGVGGISIVLPALTAMIGIFVGLAVLLRMVFAGRAHAGLPLLNGGAIVGYLIGAFAGGMSVVQALGLSPYL